MGLPYFICFHKHQIGSVLNPLHVNNNTAELMLPRKKWVILFLIAWLNVP